MTRWNEIRKYVRFGPDDEAALEAARPLVAPHFDRIVTEFYDRILEFEGARAVLTEGPAQVERLKVTLLRWLQGVFTGPWDEAYFHVRARIGRIHVRIGLEPRYMICAMAVIRWSLQTIVFQALGHAPAQLFATMRAIAKICDVELAIMLESYGLEFTSQLKRRERLAAIGQIGASVSHEVRNPLTVIATSVYALKDHCRAKEDEVAARHLERIQRSVDQANAIVTTLLDFLRQKAPDRAERDWNRVVAEAADAVPLPPGVRLELVLAPGAGRARIDEMQIGRVVANLVRNAAEAAPGSAHVTVETAGDEEAVAVAVRDRGPGLPPDVRPELFEPLFTTKAVGTGLGLALAKAIVEAHEGRIEARNRPEGGAEFLVRIPRAPLNERAGGAES